MAKVLFGKFVQDKYFLGLIKNDDFNDIVIGCCTEKEGLAGDRW